jgi:hypothetical protein
MLLLSMPERGAHSGATGTSYPVASFRAAEE